MDAFLLIIQDYHIGYRSGKESNEYDTLETIIDYSSKLTPIRFDILADGNNLFYLQKYAAELNNTLVSEPLTWMQNYTFRYQFTKAIKSYSSFLEEHAIHIQTTSRY